MTAKRNKSLAQECPELLHTWCHELNGVVDPSSLTAGSKKKYWWKCPVAEDHVWEASISNRVHGRGCPFCRGLRASSTNNLKLKAPEVAKLWDTSRNNIATPEVTSGSGKKYWWKCPVAEDHVWENSVAVQSRQKGCPFCAGKRASATNSVATKAPDLALEWHPTKNNSLTPADVTCGSGKKVWWKCLAYGHEWSAVVKSRTNGNGCPKCSNQIVSDTNNLSVNFPDIAAEWDYKKNTPLKPHDVLKGANRKVWWICPKGHSYQTTVGARTGPRRRGCGYCAGRYYTIADMQELATQKKGRCISKEYVDSKTKLTWECREGHRWEASPSDIRTGTWCPKCAGKSRRTIEEMRELAASRGGKCISNIIKNTKSPLLWECAMGHQWKTSPATIIRGRWCPECSSGLGERIIRCYFEQLFSRKFPNTRPSWLLSPKGNRMELDGYNRKLKIAFEHQGTQHYEEVSFFHSDTKTLKTRRQYDKLKRVLCEAEGITLLSVPEIPSLLPLNEVRSFIAEQLLQKGVKLPNDFLSRPVDLQKAYSTPRSIEELNNCKRIAKQHRGQLLSSSYINDSTKLEWKCAKQHLFKKPPGEVKQGQWCPVCNGNKIYSLADMREIAKSNGGKCLSKSFSRLRDKLLWSCKLGHQWEATANNVVRGSWCPFCAGNVLNTLETYKAIARERGGECLSKKYKNNKTKLLFECHKGHQWKATPAHIKSGTWCPECGGTRQLNISDMQNLAATKGGVCLSKVYVNVETPLLWQCSKGHQWHARPGNIKTGTWCPKCSNKYKPTIEDMRQLAKSKGGECLSENYKSAATKMLWRCAKGHEWRATRRTVEAGRWCKICKDD